MVFTGVAYLTVRLSLLLMIFEPELVANLQGRLDCACRNLYRACFANLMIVYTGVRLELFVDSNTIPLPNDCYLDVDDVPQLPNVGGATDIDNVLRCYTNLADCCHSAQVGDGMTLGEWYFPNGTKVEFSEGQTTTFRRNRNQRVVNLWRRGDPPERGRFHCEVPNADNVNQNIYVNICELNHRISYTVNFLVLLHFLLYPQWTLIQWLYLPLVRVPALELLGRTSC